jgi:transposase InsO family protein
MSLAYICQLFGISRQSYYQAQQRQQRYQLAKNQVIQLVQQQRRLMPRLGTRKLYYLLKEQLQTRRLKLGRDGLFRYLRTEGLLVLPARSYRKTTNSGHWMRKYPNVTKNLVVERPNQLWVADITYLEVAQGEAYLSLVTDAYSRKVVGYHVHQQLNAASVRIAFEQALAAHKLVQPLIHHSDRGSQYCSEHYQRLHRQHGIICSMTAGYDCYQNALAEHMNGILKYEFLVVRPANLLEARQMVSESVAIYNQSRPHLSLAYQTPNQVHYQQKAALI